MKPPLIRARHHTSITGSSWLSDWPRNLSRVAGRNGAEVPAGQHDEGVRVMQFAEFTLE
jgi:hypothetical protein